MREPRTVVKATWRFRTILFCLCVLFVTASCVSKTAPVSEPSYSSFPSTGLPTASLTPFPTSTPTPMPTPMPTPTPFAVPGQPRMPSEPFPARIRELIADPSAWNKTDAATGWIRRNDAILMTNACKGEAARLIGGLSIGSSMKDTLAAIGPPYMRGEVFKAYFYPGFVLALYGGDVVEAIAFQRVDSPVQNNFVVDGLYRYLGEYHRIFMEKNSPALRSADGSIALAYFDGAESFFAIYPSADKTRWIPLYTKSREYYWVNAHTFLSMDAATLVPSCYSFDIAATDPAKQIRSYPMVDIHEIDPDIRIDMRYASVNNFVKTNLYGDLTRVYMPPEAATRIAKAHAQLRAGHPGLRFMIYDAFRPKSAQKRMWDIVQGTEYMAILSNPDTWFSNHYIGLAVDITLYDTATGKELDLGTPFDSFDRLAWPRNETEMLSSGRLSQNQYANRLILREALTAQGFTQTYFEWWQFELSLGGIPNMYNWFSP